MTGTYLAPIYFPSAETFEHDLRDRTKRAELIAGDAPRSFLVTLSNEPGRALGRIEIQGPAGALATRVVAGQTCRGVVSALALIGALAVDPFADSSELGARPSEGVPPPSPVPPPDQDTRGGEAQPRP